MLQDSFCVQLPKHADMINCSSSAGIYGIPYPVEGIQAGPEILAIYNI